MKFNKSMIWVLAAGCVLTLAGCGSSKTETSTKTETVTETTTKTETATDTTTKTETATDTGTGTATSETTASTVSTYTPDLTEDVTLNMSVMYQDKATRMRYYSGNGALKSVDTYTDPAGNVYKDGDFKPVWAKMQSNLNFTINDVSDESVSKTSDAFANYVKAGWTATDSSGTALPIHIAQGSSADIIKEGTTNKTILDLNKYMDKLPYFKTFLDNNSIVRKQIVDGEGAMYYAPYFDGNDDLERMLMIRQDIVEKLLDGSTVPSFDTAKTITQSYTAFLPESVNKKIDIVSADGKSKASVTKNHSADIITTQNALATMDGKSLTVALRNYIDATYGNFYGTKRSRLFVGGQAAYDIDELVALYRCVYANPALITGDATSVMVPLYPRGLKNDRIPDLWRFTSFFGVRGVDSRNGFMYVGDDGKLRDARQSAEMRDAIKKMHEMYAEGLIFQDFANTALTTDTKNFTINTALAKANTGFSSFDYNQTQAALNDISGVTSDFLLVPTVPAVYPWKGVNGDWIHYTESWRSVKSDAWFITAQTADTPKLLDRALAVFDYLYSPEGNRLMSYGPDDCLAKNADGSIKYINYQGRQVPKLSDETIAQLADAKIGNGSYTDYYRKFLGATYPVGYVKEQGMEYQCVSQKAIPAFDEVNNAIALGVLQHVNLKSDNTDHFFDIMPTTLPFTAAEQTSLKNFSALDAAFSVTKGKEAGVYWIALVEKGYGTATYDYDTFVDTVSKPVADGGLGCTAWLSYNQDAYARMLEGK